MSVMGISQQLGPVFGKIRAVRSRDEHEDESSMVVRYRFTLPRLGPILGR
jgi:hypothetical protein